MKRFSGWAAALALVLSILACNTQLPGSVRGSGEVVTRTFDVGEFSQVELCTIGEVLLTQGEEESLVVETDENILPYLRISVRNGKLVLADRGSVALLPSDSIRFHLTAKTIDRLAVKSSGKISSEGITAADLAMEISGSGGVQLERVQAGECNIASNGSGEIRIGEVDCESVRVNMSASGGVELSGETPSLVVDNNGSGDARLSELKAAAVAANLSGSGGVTVWAVDTLEAAIDSSGSLSFYGTPRVTQSDSGSGEVRALGEH